MEWPTPFTSPVPFVKNMLQAFSKKQKPSNIENLALSDLDGLDLYLTSLPWQKLLVLQSKVVVRGSSLASRLIVEGQLAVFTTESDVCCGFVINAFHYAEEMEIRRFHSCFYCSTIYSIPDLGKLKCSRIDECGLETSVCMNKYGLAISDMKSCNSFLHG